MSKGINIIRYHDSLINFDRIIFGYYSKAIKDYPDLLGSEISKQIIHDLDLYDHIDTKPVEMRLSRIRKEARSIADHNRMVNNDLEILGYYLRSVADYPQITAREVAQNIFDDADFDCKLSKENIEHRISRVKREINIEI